MNVNWTRGALIAAVVGMTLTWAGDARADDDRKLDRQIDLFERVVDDMLVDSPNWLVQSSRETRGRHRNGTGLRFTFDASLVGGKWGWDNHRGNWWSWWDDDDRGGVIYLDEDDLDDLDAEEIEAMVKSKKKSRERRTERAMKKQERLYERGKAEMIDVMLDFGDVFTRLPGDETIELTAYLEDAEYFYEKDLRTLSISAKVSDLKAFGDGSLSEQDMVNRITVTEE